MDAVMPPPKTPPPPAGGRFAPGPLLRALWKRWTVIARAIGNFQARVILTLFYFVVVPPFALLLRVSRDPLRLRARTESFWVPRAAREPDTGQRQY
jgi:hypothetical protein